MANGYAAVGTTFQLGVTTVGQLESISGVTITADTIDVTSLGSTGGYREFIGGFRDGGEVELAGFFTAGAGQELLAAAVASGTAYSCQITFPAALSANWQFDGVVVKFGTDTSVGDAIKFSATVKVSGAPTLTS